MYFSLYFTREIKVDIGRFIAVEAEEGFKRDIVAVPYHLSAAVRAGFRCHIETAPVFALEEEFAVFALRAEIMRSERIYL